MVKPALALFSLLLACLVTFSPSAQAASAPALIPGDDKTFNQTKNGESDGSCTLKGAGTAGVTTGAYEELAEGGQAAGRAPTWQPPQPSTIAA